MKHIFTKLTAAGALLSVSCLINVANAGVIFSEDFSGGSTSLVNSTNVAWADSSGIGFEVYQSGSASPRGMSGTYDHDNDPTTAQIKIPGAIEVNDNAGNVTLTATFTLDSAITANQEGLLTFFGGARQSSDGASVEVFNVTQNTTLSGVLESVLTTKEWTFNSFAFNTTAAAAGDEIQVRWIGGGSNSANGQEVALVNLSVVDVPAPATAAILALGLLGFGARRFKK
ncbi:PEP-CTERM sorting domain-containing protein [Psychromonas sp. SR45-3]|uniref:PEP-CTERM sorting domain-containing protein n=1 Tax=Psychromonas sp. SR45-3 TaxID=2760930 RepID=UPI0015FB756E|nr:PEP-CTERM sorting domain-containing protein [Psychromonas sp. SR45-3]MBB1274092.1 PEP-CTERM sorting domain-containing protein [Psychromonas sp. SR45-3]